MVELGKQTKKCATTIDRTTQQAHSDTRYLSELQKSMSTTFNDQQKKLSQLTSKVDKSIRLQKIQLTDEQEK